MRWKGVIAFAVILVLLCGFGLFFADNMVKGALESIGGSIAGARVEIARFQMSALKLLLNIGGLQVADPDNEWQNQIEIKDVRFDMDWSALLQKKIVINEMAIDCIQRGTKRTTSGKLPVVEEKKKEKKKHDFTGEKTAIEDETAKLPIMEMLKGNQKFNADELVSADKLATPAEIKKSEDAVNARHQAAQASVNGLNISARVVQIRQQVNDLDFKEIKPAKLKQEVKKLKEIKQNVDQLKTDLTSTDRTVQADFDGLAGSLKNIDQMKEQDYLNVIGSISSIQSITKEGIARLLFGPVWLDRVNSFLYWLDLAKNYMPSGDEKPPAPPKFKGIDVEFPRINSYPGFLLKVASITTGLGNNPAELKFHGKIEGISSNPRLYGKPAFLIIKGSEPNFELQAVLDHTQSVSRDTGRVNINGMDIKGFSLAKSSALLPKQVSQGLADITVDITSQGSRVELLMNILPRNLVFAPEDVPANDLAREIANALATAPNLKIEGKITIEKGKPDFKITSTVDQIITDSFKRIIDARVEAAKQEARKKLDQIIDGPKNALMSNLTAKRGSINELLKGNNTAVDDLKKEVDAKLDKFGKLDK
ncbi:MAG: TIGR03545 family protein [Candidatus Brocadiia bacterium]